MDRGAVQGSVLGERGHAGALPQAPPGCGPHSKSQTDRPGNEYIHFPGCLPGFSLPGSSLCVSQASGINKFIYAHLLCRLDGVQGTLSPAAELEAAGASKRLPNLTAFPSGICSPLHSRSSCRSSPFSSGRAGGRGPRRRRAPPGKARNNPRNARQILLILIPAPGRSNAPAAP